MPEATSVAIKLPDSGVNTFVNWPIWSQWLQIVFPID
jgi:hypothetical protein